MRVQVERSRQFYGRSRNQMGWWEYTYGPWTYTPIAHVPGIGAIRGSPMDSAREASTVIQAIRRFKP